MKKVDVKLGETYYAKVSGNLATVKLLSESPRGGWEGINTKTGEDVRIKTAAQLPYTYKDGFRHVARQIV